MDMRWIRQWIFIASDLFMLGHFLRSVNNRQSKMTMKDHLQRLTFNLVFPNAWRTHIHLCNFCKFLLYKQLEFCDTLFIWGETQIRLLFFKLRSFINGWNWCSNQFILFSSQVNHLPLLCLNPPVILVGVVSGSVKHQGTPKELLQGCWCDVALTLIGIGPSWFGLMKVVQCLVYEGTDGSEFVCHLVFRMRRT